VTGVQTCALPISGSEGSDPDELAYIGTKLYFAANDGQLHFFDAGIRKLIYDPTQNRNVPLFTDGTGLELFSYMPRLAMPVVGEQFNGSAITAARLPGHWRSNISNEMSSSGTHQSSASAGMGER